jgi:hypothetical protein
LACVSSVRGPRNLSCYVPMTASLCSRGRRDARRFVILW